MRPELPPHDARLRLEPVELPDVTHLIGGGSAHDREQWRRDARARTAYQLVELDGRPVPVGLFVTAVWAELAAHEHGWTVLPTPAAAAAPATSGGLAR